MYDADALEAINSEQLVTATDRMLLRGGRGSKRRPSVPSLVYGPRGSQPSIIPPPSFADGSQPSIHLAALARASQPSIQPATVARACQPTTVIRAARASRSQAFALTVVIPTLAGIVVGLVAML